MQRDITERLVRNAFKWTPLIFMFQNPKTQRFKDQTSYKDWQGNDGVIIFHLFEKKKNQDKDLSEPEVRKRDRGLEENREPNGRMRMDRTSLDETEEEILTKRALITTALQDVPSREVLE